MQAKYQPEPEPLLVSKETTKRALGGIGDTTLYELLKGPLVGRKMGKLLLIEWQSVKALAASLPLKEPTSDVAARLVEGRRQRREAKRNVAV